MIPLFFCDTQLQILLIELRFVSLLQNKLCILQRVLADIPENWQHFAFFELVILPIQRRWETQADPRTLSRGSARPVAVVKTKLRNTATAC